MATRECAPDQSGVLRIAQLSTAATGGGAEKVARILHAAFRERGHAAELWVGRPPAHEIPGVAAIDQAYSGMVRRPVWVVEGWLRARTGRVRGAGRLATLLRRLAITESGRAWRAGHEDFAFPGVWRLLETWTSAPPDVIHGHNLHGDYFDLRALPALSRLAPMALTLHDEWLLTGHCAYSLGCDAWTRGCGGCPHLNVYPALRRDGTAENWERKRSLYAQSRLYVAAPSQWLLDEVAASPLAGGVAATRLIRVGIDRRAFNSSGRATARARVGLPADAAVVMFAANGTRANPWKDFATVKGAASRLVQRLSGKRLILLAVGQGGALQSLEGAELRMVPFVSEPARLADYYRASDVYLHAARADNSPAVILEAMACGTPVVATAIGGIPELVESGRTGWLTAPGDPDGMAAMAARLLVDPGQWTAFAQTAEARIEREFTFERQVQAYLNWFQELIKMHQEHSRCQRFASA